MNDYRVGDQIEIAGPRGTRVFARILEFLSDGTIVVSVYDVEELITREDIVDVQN